MGSPAPSYTCVCCGYTAHHRDDVEQRYCIRCHWWTGDPELGPPHLHDPCEARQQAAVSQVLHQLQDEAGELAGHR